MRQTVHIPPDCYGINVHVTVGSIINFAQIVPVSPGQVLTIDTGIEFISEFPGIPEDPAGDTGDLFR